mgnify:FL=1
MRFALLIAPYAVEVVWSSNYQIVAGRVRKAKPYRTNGRCGRLTCGGSVRFASLIAPYLLFNIKESFLTSAGNSAVTVTHTISRSMSK